MRGFGIGIAQSRPCAAGRGTRACQGWQSFASLDWAIPVSEPADTENFVRGQYFLITLNRNNNRKIKQ